jgi:hypothetical protein
MDPFALVFGLTFAAIGSAFLFGVVDLTDLHLQWTWPLPLIVLGLLIVGLSFRRARESRPEPTIAEPAIAEPANAEAPDEP